VTSQSRQGERPGQGGTAESLENLIRREEEMINRREKEIEEWELKIARLTN
jgi:hypothetical protein